MHDLAELMQYAIGIELGENRLRIAAVNRGGEIFSKRSLALPAKDALRADAPEYVADLINETQLEAGYPARWLGLAAAGVPDPGAPASFVRLPQRLEPLQGFAWDQPPFNAGERGTNLTNTAQAALFAEHWRGAAKNRSHILLLRVETELHAAIMAGGELLRGAGSMAGMLQDIWLPRNPAESRSKSSGTAMRAVEVLGEKALAGADHNYRSYKALIDAAGDGDAEARDIWRVKVQEFARLSAALAGVVDPEIILFDGPLATARDLLLKPLSQALEKVLLEYRDRNLTPDDSVCPRLAVSQLGAYGAAIGAARYAMLHARTALPPPKERGFSTRG